MRSLRPLNWRKASVAVGIIVLSLGFSALPAFGDSLLVVGATPNGQCAQAVQTGSATVSCSGPAFGDTATASGNLAAGTFGASVTVSPPNPLVGSSASASAEITYNFAVTGTQSGTAQFDLTIPGTLSGSTTGCTDPGGCIGLNAQLSYPGQEGILIGGVPGPQGFLNLSGGDTDLVVGTLITNGVVQLTLEISENVSCGANFSTCSATADFLDPLAITGASVYDANGNLVSGATLVSDSGFNPNAGSPVPTPEPGSLPLLAAGLMGLFVISARRAVA